MTGFKSKLTRSEFLKRINSNTKKGNPKLKGSPLASVTMFGQAEKNFYGEISGNQFRITKNGVLFPIPYILNGVYKPDKKMGIIVSYEIEKIWFGYLWIRIMPFVALVAVNAIFIFHGNNIEPIAFIPINIFLLLMFTPILIVRHQKNRFLKRFHKIFELERIDK